MTGEQDKDTQADAIDADFEPAPAADYVLPETKDSAGGPGWLPFGLVAALAAGSLGLSVWSHSQDGGGSENLSASQYLELVTAQDATSKDLSALKKAAEESENRMAAQIESLLTGGENGDGLETLVSELEIVSDRLDAAMGESLDADAISSIEARLNALENIEEGESVSPRDVRASIVALSNRMDEIVSQNEEVESLLERRADALSALTSRIEDLELSQTGGAAVLPADQANILQNLQAELDSLKTTVQRGDEIDQENDQRFSEILSGLQAAGAAENKTNAALEQALLAFSKIETAAEGGRPFRADFQKLRGAMPDDPSVQKLATISQKSVPTLSELSDRFAGDKSAAVAFIEEDAPAGWGWTRQIFGDGVKVRKAGEPDGALDILERASVQLETDDLNAAIISVKQLSGEPASVMEDWLADAQLRLELNETLGAVRNTLNTKGR